MSGQGRSSAMKVVLVLCIVALIQTEMAQAAVYNVGGSGGWTFNTVSWPRGKRFRAGDILAFNYPSGAHNVVAVNKDGYNNCRTPRGSKVYTKGGDKIKLVKGQNYFICNFVGHCESGMKISVFAS
ncbi:PREDICTED: basic blue protein [Nicotiana attenuata]|uniref:Basic blue protein n=1 Tax=Nicotiana attenuata TaxID=49451 RepID=A0A314L1D4_NICAT|nr:PREDICTED: basic blue protein [Nicotiana attenuata]OIT35448.1 basic blue protein [Nicotiana attenuata]